MTQIDFGATITHSNKQTGVFIMEATKRITKHIVSQSVKDGIVYTMLKTLPPPKQGRSGRLLPVFAKPKSKYRVG